MRKPSIEKWSRKFVWAVVRNLPKVETFVYESDICSIAMVHVRQAVRDICGNANPKDGKEVIENEEAR